MQTPNSETSENESQKSVSAGASGPAEALGSSVANSNQNDNASGDSNRASVLNQSRSAKPFFAQRAYLLAGAAVLAALSGFFFRAVFLGKPITKLGLLPRIDAALNPSLTDAVIPIGRDPSGYLIFFPNGHFCEQVWSRFVIPLWNPLVACGFPLLGDPQSFIHSPAHLLGLFASPAAYNFGLLLEIALGGIGMLIAARLMSLSAPAAVLAALAYSLSPRVLVQIDIGGNEEFFPWIVACFVWLAKKPTYLRAAIAGAASAFLVFAAHPETSFFAILTAGILGFCMIAINGRADYSASRDMALQTSTGKSADLDSTTPSSTPLSNLWLSTKLMSVAAIVSMLVVSPLLVPFIQFMKQANVYKDALSSAELPFETWKSFWDGVLVNQGYEPFFIGSLAVLLCPLAFAVKNRFLLPLTLTAMFIFAISVPQGPFLDILSKKPFNYVSTLYGIPDLLLLLSLLAGFGFEALFKHRDRKLVVPLLLGAALAAVYPILFCLERSGGVLSDAWRANGSLLTYTTIFSGAGFAFALLWLYLPNSATRTIAMLALIAFNFASVAVPSRQILPNCPAYDMTPTAPLKFLADTNERTVSTGNNFVLPNASMNYGVRDLRCFCPVLPRRYTEFLQASGAQVYNNYFYRMPDACSDLLDAASVKYVMTRSAISGASDDSTKLFALGKSRVGGVLPGMRILNSKLFFDPPNRQVQFNFELKMQKPLNHRYAIQFCVVGKDGQILWNSSETRISIVHSGQNNVYVEHIPVPEHAQFPVSAGFRIRDTWTSKWVSPSETQSHAEPGSDASKDVFVAAVVERQIVANPSEQKFPATSEVSRPSSTGAANSSFAQLNPHYKLVREFQKEGCRIYENTRALPQAYFVQHVWHATPRMAGEYSALLDQLRDPAFDMHQRAIVEDHPQDESEDPIGYPRCVDDNAKITNDHETTKSPVVPARVERPDSNSVLCTVDAPAAGYLVLTDSNYDGWKCTVDGKDTKIYDCNLLFKAVRIEAGKHTIRFVFAPASYYVSLALSLITLLVIGVSSLMRRRNL